MEVNSPNKPSPQIDMKPLLAIIVAAAAVAGIMVFFLTSSSQSLTGQASQSGQLSSAIAQQKLEQYSVISRNAKGYEVDYTLSILSQPTKTLLRLYVLNNTNKKAFITEGSLGNVTLYDLNGTVTICSQLSNRTSCQKSNYTLGQSYDMQSLLGVNFSNPYLNASYLGTGMIAGRPCDRFTIISNGQNSSLLSAFTAQFGVGKYGQINTTQNGSYRFTACIDKSYGTPLQVGINYSYYSTILNQNQTSELINMTATGFNTTVSKSQFIPPDANYTPYSGSS